MALKKVATEAVIYQLKVTLIGSSPPIWRRLLAPAALSLAQLHLVLQAAMGWRNKHLHEFVISGRRFGVPDPDEPGLPNCLDDRHFRLSDVMPGPGAEARYDYDFGDDWQHALIVEKVVAPEAGRVYPRCLEGEMQGPPEDCGGIPGFYNMVEAINDPKHCQFDWMRRWIGGAFDPQSFSPATVNRRLRQRIRLGQMEPAPKRPAPRRKTARDVRGTAR